MITTNNKNDEINDEIKEEIKQFKKFLEDSFESEKSVYAIITSSRIDPKWTTWKFLTFTFVLTQDPVDAHTRPWEEKLPNCNNFDYYKYRVFQLNLSDESSISDFFMMLCLSDSMGKSLEYETSSKD